MTDAKALSILLSLITIALSAWTIHHPAWWRLWLVLICWAGVIGVTVVNMEYSR